VIVAIILLMIAYDARFYSSQERDDGKVDEEDDGESEEQH